MLQTLVTAALRHRWLTLAIALFICAAGALSMCFLSVDAFPDTTPIQVQINTTAPSLVPEEVERQITMPIELALGGLRGLEQLRSVSQFGLSQVVVTFADGTDIYFARQLINERLSNLELAPGITRPTMGPVSTGLGEVFHYFLKSDESSLTDLRTMQDWSVKPLLRPVAGTAEVNSWGGFKKQFQIQVDPARLLQYQIGFDEVIRAVEDNNLNVGGGYLEHHGEMLLIHGLGRTVDVSQIEAITLSAKQGTPIRVRDVGRVVIGHEVRRGAVTANGQGEVVLGLCFMLMGENSYAVTQRMEQQWQKVEAALPKDVQTTVAYNRRELVDKVLQTVRSNLCEGALLVVTVLYLFLGNLRAGLVVAAAIPCALLFAFCGMYQAGIAGTLLSLGAIDFGVVVDSSLVMVESIFARIAHDHRQRSRWESVKMATLAVCRPTMFGQLIIMIVYLPLLTLAGVEGKMFRPMAITVMLVLAGSLVVSLTLIPVLAYWFLPKQVQEEDVWLVRAARRIYEPLVQGAIRWKISVVTLGALALVFGGAILLGLGSEFMPRLSEGAIVIGIARGPGCSLSESLRVNTLMERQLLAAFPDEIDQCWSRIGAPEVATDPSGVEQTDLFVTLRDRQRWKRAKNQEQLVNQMEQELADIPGQVLWFTQPIEQRINEMISGVRSDVAVKIFGDDLGELIRKAGEVSSVLRQLPGCADLSTEQVTGQPVLSVKVRQDQIAHYAVDAKSVLDLIAAIGHKEIGEVMQGQLRIPLAVSLQEQIQDRPTAVQAMLVSTPQGEQLPLSRLADIGVAEGPKTISREWGKRRITVQCNVRGRDVGSFVAAAQAAVQNKVTLPDASYRIEWGGQFDNMQRAQARLAIALPLALALVLILLYVNYRNVTDSLLVFASVPLACVGGVCGLWLRQMPMSISAAVGMITLCGLSVLNSMIFVASLRRWLASVAEPVAAIRLAALECLRTVLMTSLVASVGFIPMATSDGVGAEVQRPLATVVIGGVGACTILSLFILPALYAIFLGTSKSPQNFARKLGSIGWTPSAS